MHQQHTIPRELVCEWDYMHQQHIIPDCDTSSRSFPSTLISSLVPVGEHVTPGLIRTVRVYFSPKKFLISTTVFPSLMLILMGKWAYTARILYRNPWGKQTKMLLGFNPWITSTSFFNLLNYVQRTCIVNVNSKCVALYTHSLTLQNLVTVESKRGWDCHLYLLLVLHALSSCMQVRQSGWGSEGRGWNGGWCEGEERRVKREWWDEVKLKEGTRRGDSSVEPPTLLTWSTPLNIFLMWPQIVCRQASCFRLANQMSTRSLFFPTLVSSRSMCRKDFVRVPRGPVTVTTRLFTLRVTVCVCATMVNYTWSLEVMHWYSQPGCCNKVGMTNDVSWATDAIVVTNGVILWLIPKPLINSGMFCFPGNVNRGRN